jgi:hypothetical protein
MADEDKNERATRETAAQDRPKESPSPPGRTVPRADSPGAQASPARPPGPANAPIVENREAPHGFGQSGAAPPNDPNRASGQSSGRYRLLAAHMMGGHHLPAGTEVGTDTGYPVMVPSNQMEGVDDAGKAKVNEIHQRLYGRDAPWHDPEHPVAQAVADAEAAAAQREEEEAQPPVSHQQAWERGHEEYRGAKLSGPPAGPLVTRSISGDTSQPMGPAPAEQDIRNPDVQVRTTRPLQDQMPKEGAAGGGLTHPGRR